METKTVAQKFAQTLKEIGIKYVFGVPSGSMIDYIEAIRETRGIDFILVSHESGAGFMAYVCGRLTNIPGACFATFGPGATNLTTGVGGALLDRAMGNRTMGNRIGQNKSRKNKIGSIQYQRLKLQIKMP